MNTISPKRKLGAVLSAVLGAVAGLSAAPGAAADECRMKQIADIPARIAPENQLLIQVGLNGKPVELRLDTGLGISAISRSLVQRLGLPIETSHELRYQYALNDVFKVFAEPGTEGSDPGYAGSELTERTRIPKLVLGGAVTEFEEFAVVPVGGDGSDNRPVGVFGNDYLLLYDLELDPAGGKVKLFEQDHCGDRVVHWATQYSTLPIRVDPGDALGGRGSSWRVGRPSLAGAHRYRQRIPDPAARDCRAVFRAGRTLARRRRSRQRCHHRGPRTRCPVMPSISSR